MSEFDEDQGVSNEEILDTIESKLEESEFLDDMEQDPQPSAETEEVEEEPQEVPIAASRAELDVAYQQLQHDAARLQQQTSSVDWQRLRQENPAEYAILAREVQAAQQALASREQAITGAAQKFSEKALNDEKAKLLKSIPSWRDDSTADREKGQLRDWLMAQGYSMKEISGASARDISTAYKAWKNSQAPTEKKVLRLKKSRQIPGLNRKAQRDMEKHAKRRPGGEEDIMLRLIKSGYA